MGRGRARNDAWVLKRPGDIVVCERCEMADTVRTRMRGLLGRDGLEPGAALVIAPCNSIHMFFMRFAIDVVYVDRAGRVRKIVRALRPWRISAAMSAYAVIELGAGSLDGRDIERGDRLYVEVGGAAPPPKQ